MDTHDLEGLPEHLEAYARGETDIYPSTAGVSRKQRLAMERVRRTYIRNLLNSNRARAHALPDFHSMLSDEIWRFAKTELQPKLFQEWDDRVGNMPRFIQLFNRISARLHREWVDAVEEGKPRITHRYLSITAKRHAFKQAVLDLHTLGEIEKSCLGKLKYGAD